MTKQTDAEWQMPIKSGHTPEVIAYRVGELERKTTGGFAALNKKLDDYMNTFATKDDLKEVRTDMVNKEEYVALRTKLIMLLWVIASISVVVIGIFVKQFVDIMTKGQL